MGDLEKDTDLDELGGGRFRARLSSDWMIWGPAGGYLAAVALRAAGAHAGLPRPVSFMAHYLSVAAFDEVDVEVTTLRAGRRTASLRVSVTQGGDAVLEAMVWAGSEPRPVEGDAFEHDDLAAPDVPGPDGLPTVEERVAALPEDQRWPTGQGFWKNLEEKPTEWYDRWEDRPRRPEWTTWFRFRPAPTFANPWVDACRALVVLDLMQWPAASRGHGQHGWMAPSLDLAVLFHRPLGGEWLLGRGHSPVATEGLVGGAAQLWDDGGRLVATASQQMLLRPMPARPS